MNRNDKLWSELSKEEKAEEKREFLESYVQGCGGSSGDYSMYWEEYLNQEGYTGRDERILMQRDCYQEFVAAKAAGELDES